MKLFALLWTLFIFPITPSFSSAIDQEIPLEAILGNKLEFIKWKSPFKKWYDSQIDLIPGFTPVGHKILKKEKIDDITLLTIQFEYPPGTPLVWQKGGGVLALPNTIDKRRPVVITIHGHEHNPWGQHSINLFSHEKWPWKIAKDGYIVWAPVSMYHEEIKSIGESKGYLISWTKIISEGIKYAQNIYWEKPRAGYVAAGLSSGGTIGFFLMAYRPDITIGIFAGADPDLDFLRREYRIKGHPNCWDVKGISSYTTIQSLIAPRPVQFQIGKQDPFFPDRTPLKKQGNWFSGTSRDVLSAEAGGNMLVLRSIYEMYGKSENYTSLIHQGGHEMDSNLALQFLHKHSVISGMKN